MEVPLGTVSLNLATLLTGWWQGLYLSPSHLCFPMGEYEQLIGSWLIVGSFDELLH